MPSDSFLYLWDLSEMSSRTEGGTKRNDEELLAAIKDIWIFSALFAWGVGHDLDPKALAGGRLPLPQHRSSCRSSERGALFTRPAHSRLAAQHMGLSTRTPERETTAASPRQLGSGGSLESFRAR